MSNRSGSFLRPNAGSADRATDTVSRRRLLTGGLTAGALASAGCLGSDDGAVTADTVLVFNTGESTVSLIDPSRDARIGTRAVGISSSFPSNQFTPTVTTDRADSLWVNVGRGVRGLAAGSLSETASVTTGSGANWLEQTPDGAHLIVSAREPSHSQFRIDAATDSATFGEVTATLDRTSEGGPGQRDGPGPCDVTIHPNGSYAYVPDLYGSTLTVLSIDPFEIVNQISVSPVGDGPAKPWMGTASPAGDRLVLEHAEGDTGTESIWDISDPAAPTELARLTRSDGLGVRPLTSEIGPDSETAYVFTPGSSDISVIDLDAEVVRDTIDLGGQAYVGTWNPDHTKLYATVQTSDEVAVIDHAAGAIVERIGVGQSPYGATATRVRPDPSGTPSLSVAMAQLGLASAETTYCIGNCACGHEL